MSTKANIFRFQTKSLNEFIMKEKQFIYNQFKKIEAELGDILVPNGNSGESRQGFFLIPSQNFSA